MVRSTQVAKPYGVTDAKVDIWAAPNLPFVVGFPGLDNTQVSVAMQIMTRKFQRPQGTVRHHQLPLHTHTHEAWNGNDQKEEHTWN